MPRIKGQRGLINPRTNGKFEPDFRFVLTFDPALEGWRAWAAEYWTALSKRDGYLQSALTAFLIKYLHEQGLHTLAPDVFFAKDRRLPELDSALGLALIRDEGNAKRKHDVTSDFLAWVLREKLSVLDADGRRVVPPNLANPFPRRQAKASGKAADTSFNQVRLDAPKLEDWCDLAAEWLMDCKAGLDRRRQAVLSFLVIYIRDQGLEHNYGRFLLRKTEKPNFTQVIVNAKRQGTQTLQASDVDRNNYVADFLDWVLAHKLSDPETGAWDTSRFHNPIQRLSKSGCPTCSQSNKASLSIRYIRQLRRMLAEGRNFRDWKWAQRAMEGGRSGGDWFVVDPKLIDHTDPDCVAKQRDASMYEKKKWDYPDKVWEMWSPVRAVALYLKLELPLRTFQVRMLDSGEADTWRYVHALGGDALY